MMKVIQANIFILPVILLLSACTSVQTKETSINKIGQEVTTETSEFSINPSVFSRFINILLGKPVPAIEAEPVVAAKVEEVPVKSKPEPVAEESITDKTPTKDPECPFKINVKTADSAISIDC